MLLWNLVIIPIWRSMLWVFFFRRIRILQQDPFALSCTLEPKYWMQTHFVSIIFFCSSYMWRLKYIKSTIWFLILRAFWMYISFDNIGSFLAQYFRQTEKGFVECDRNLTFSNENSTKFVSHSTICDGGYRVCFHISMFHILITEELARLVTCGEIVVIPFRFSSLCPIVWLSSRVPTQLSVHYC